MKVVGIDSAELSGLAVVARPAGGREQLVHSGVATIRTAADVERIASELAAYAPDVVAIEEAWSHPAHPRAGLALATLCGRWLQAFESRGFTCVTIPASMWQPALLTGLMPSRAKRPQRKLAAQAWCLATFGIEATEDEADAVAIAAYTLRNATRKPATRRAA
jgi:Holliday junction resolvasome RuvABC endonuclease subunit